MVLHVLHAWGVVVGVVLEVLQACGANVGVVLHHVSDACGVVVAVAHHGFLFIGSGVPIHVAHKTKCDIVEVGFKDATPWLTL